MTTRPQRTNGSHLLLVFLAGGLLAALLAILTATGTWASTAAVAETRVGASAVVVEVPVGPPERIGAGQRLGNEPVRVVVVVATGVAAKTVSETAGGLTNLGTASSRLNLDEFAAGQGFSGVYDQATGSMLALPSSRASQLPANWVSARGGHAVVNARLSQALGTSGGGRAGFTAFLDDAGGLRVEWLSRSVNGMADPFVPTSLRPAILEALATTTGRTTY